MVCRSYFACILIINCLITIYVNLRQIKYLSNGKYNKAKPIFTASNFSKGCDYSKEKIKFSIFSLIVSNIKTYLSLLYCNQLYFTLFSSRKNADASFFIIYMIFDLISDLPLNAYSDFVIENKFGFNKKSVLTFFKDFSLYAMLIIAIGYPTASIAFLIIEKFKNFSLYLWLFLSIISIFMVVIHPTFIAPLFNKFKLLDNEDLKTKIEKVADKINFPLGNIYVIDGSKRSGHSNAYFTGFSKNKQIVFYDTIFKDLNEDEILAVLVHELGHWKKCHIYSLLVMGLFELFVLIYSFNLYINKFSSGSIAIRFIEFSSIYSILSLPTSLGKNYLVRKFERQADKYSVDLGYGEDLKKALVKLHEQNNSSPIVDPVFSAFYYSHPHTLERIELIEQMVKKDE